ncbi:MAG: Spy/CpxP family protein refolding chaperone [Nitrospinota bacterium]|nr:Spy/CpxP family protein refolding chaperone [Nitrospinota bacterium]
MKKMAVVLVSSAILFSTAYSASADSRGMRDGERYHRSGESFDCDRSGGRMNNIGDRQGRGIRKDAPWGRRMELNKDQEEKITKIRGKYRDKLTSKREELFKARREYHQKLRSSAHNQDLLVPHKRMQKLVIELSDLRFKAMLETRGILTGEQRKRIGHIE